ncbi:MAG: hypothetical protein QOJ29_1868, partial [Thermoleophilaceae bacterium]|nr:hypothetical protein [Thermoleophilaceae bacterium]
MGAGPYAAGVAFFLVTTGASAFTAVLLVRRMTHLDGAPRWLALALLFTFALVVAHMVPGIFGILTRWTAALSAVLGLLGTRLVLGRRSVAGVDAVPGNVLTGEDGPIHARLIAGIGAAAIAAFVAGYYRTEITHSVSSDDMLNFHLPLVANWIQGHSFWPVVDLLPYDTTGNYPQNGDVLMLAGVLPWRGEAFARLTVVPYVGLTGLATYGLARELRADRGRAALMACVVTATPILLLSGVASALPDVVMYGTFGAGLVFLTRCARTLATSDALLAGLGLGIAFGTKWYAVPAVVAVLFLFGVALLFRARDRRAIRTLALTSGAVAVAGGFWLVRNAVESGSPFFPAGWLPIGARSDVGNPAPRSDFPILHYLFDGTLIRHVILPDELRAFGIGGALLLLGTLVAAALAARWARRGDRAAASVLGVVAAALVLALVYIVTPNTASGFEGHPVLVYYSARYLVPAAIPAAAALAWVATRAGRAGLVIDILAAAAIADGLRRAFDLPLGTIVVGALVIGALAALALGLARVAHASPGWLAASLATLMAFVVVGGYVVQHRYADHRLRGDDAAIDYFLDHAREGDGVGLAEQWSVLP